MSIHKISGELGAFGGGMGLRVLYLQCALPVQDIAQIKLAEELPGSDEWPVRDLFQRDVDYSRVEKGILPWLVDPNKVKFFAPITLAILPFDNSTERLEAEIPVVTRDHKACGVRIGKVCKLQGEHLPDTYTGRAVLSWDASQCHLVALDGQHRVATIREAIRRGGPGAATIETWSIPAVVICVIREKSQAGTQRISFLDVARSVFVYINTQARVPSRARQILLNDESPAAIFAQEFVQHSHEGDIESLTHFPMCALKWRDGTETDVGIGHKLLHIEEVHDLVNDLLLASVGVRNREVAAHQLAQGERDGTRLAELMALSSLNPEESQELRECLRGSLVPAFANLIVRLTPLQRHAERLRIITRKLLDAEQPGREALNAIQIGGTGNWRARAEVARLVTHAVKEMERSTRSIPELFRHDIGLRGIVSGLVHLLPFLREQGGAGATLDDLARRYVDALNERLAEGWLIGTTERMVRHLRHVTRNEGGTVKHYRLTDVPDALGALCGSIAASAMFRRTNRDLRDLLKGLLRQRLFETVRGGYVGELKKHFREQYPQWSTGEIKDKAQEKSRPTARAHIDRIVEDLGFQVTDV
jgi:hypothetical protein